ncbi:unnamed protein product [Prorocentrum cordatum]|uniref:Selenoprotein O n=1 Tax=Prorocentrum cordatum TaxID=2364126 RepID=A0ABN9XUD0_9DINO|nr:unnamed protein product [Polarella glacialis]
MNAVSETNLQVVTTRTCRTAVPFSGESPDRCFPDWLEGLGFLEENLSQAGPCWVQPREGGGGTFKFSSRDPIWLLQRRVPVRAGSLVLWDTLLAHGSCPNASANFRVAQFVRGFRAGQMSPPRAAARAEATRTHLRAAGALQSLGPLAPHVFGVAAGASPPGPAGSGAACPGRRESMSYFSNEALAAAAAPALLWGLARQAGFGPEDEVALICEASVWFKDNPPTFVLGTFDRVQAYVSACREVFPGLDPEVKHRIGGLLNTGQLVWSLQNRWKKGVPGTAEGQALPLTDGERCAGTARRKNEDELDEDRETYLRVAASFGRGLDKDEDEVEHPCSVPTTRRRWTRSHPGGHPPLARADGRRGAGSPRVRAGRGCSDPIWEASGSSGWRRALRGRDAAAARLRAPVRRSLPLAQVVRFDLASAFCSARWSPPQAPPSRREQKSCRDVR